MHQGSQRDKDFPGLWRVNTWENLNFALFAVRHSVVNKGQRCVSTA